MTNFTSKVLAEFDEKFPAHDTSHCIGHTFPKFEVTPNRAEIKAFITEKLEAQKHEILGEIIDSLPTAKIPNYQIGGEYKEDEGFNECLEQVKTILTDLKHD